MTITLAIVDISSGTSSRLLRLQQLQICMSTATLLLALWQAVCNLVAACVASLAVAKSSVKENARSSLVLMKRASHGTSRHVAAWLHGHSNSSSKSGQAVVRRQLQGLASPYGGGYKCLVDRPTGSSSSSAGRLYCLPPQLPQHRGRLTVFLDLDETLLCTYRLLRGPDSLQLVPSHWTSTSSSSSRRRRSLTSMLLSSGSTGSRQGSSAGSTSNGYRVTTSGSCEGEFCLLGREVDASCWMHYTPLHQGGTPALCGSSWSSAGATTTLAVFERPGVRQFLQQLMQFAEPVLFTAASAAYAEPLVDLLDPDHTIFSARLYSDACSSACGRDGVKDLAGLGRHLGRAVLVDNSPYSFLLQPANGLPCLPYHGDQGDRQLLCVILPLLRSLSQLGDIRPLLDSKFRVREWLASKGVTPPPAYQSRQAAEEGW